MKVNKVNEEQFDNGYWEAKTGKPKNSSNSDYLKGYERGLKAVAQLARDGREDRLAGLQMLSSHPVYVAAYKM